MRIVLALLAITASCRSQVPDRRVVSFETPRTGFGKVDPQLAYQMRQVYASQVHRTGRPIELQSADGSELALTTLRANVKIDGPLARTELRMMFHNPQARVREGRFRIELPAGAAVGRFAMRVGTELREARVVSRAKGREVYEGFLKQRVDPALLEQDAGNQFSARVFPIEAQAEKEIVIGYDHAISYDEPYVLRLQGLRAGSVKVIVERDGVRSEHVPPDGHDFTQHVMRGNTALAANGAFVASIALPDTGARPMPVDRTLFLVDTSASRAPVMGKQIDLLAKLTPYLVDATIAVAAFDHEVTEIARGTGNSISLTELYDHGALGASDLGRAIDYAVGSGMRRVVLIGDGTPTLGETDPGKLAAKIAASKIERFDVLQVSDTIDRELLGVLVRAGKQSGAIIDGRNPIRARAQLERGIGSEVPISVLGATDVWPRTTRGLVSGSRVLIAGRAADTRALAIRIGAYRVAISPQAGDAASIRRTVARHELADLADRIATTGDARERGTLEARVEKVALEHNLLSARTSLLVLETDADEARTLGPRDVPRIDPTSTTQGITIDRDYTRNIPVPARTFESALGQAAGSQGDGVGVAFSGSTSLENRYYVDGTGQVIDKAKRETPYTGMFAEVMSALARNERGRALEIAMRARLANAGDVLAILALGEALEASGAKDLAARAYGSLVDLYPNRDDLARAAGQRLDRVGARELAIDAYRRALRERPDRPTTYRQLAYALLRGGRADEALEVVLQGVQRATGPIADTLSQDARVIAAAIVARDPARAASVGPRVGSIPRVPSLQIVLAWETDANDVDLHVRDKHGKTALFSTPALASGGKLTADITTGFGPELFVVENPQAFPYSIDVHYYSRGPMGFGIGTVQVIRHDGAGKVTVEDRPFVLQKDGAMIELGAVRR